jgi:hypothetical protein
MGRINLTQDRSQCSALVNIVMNLQVAYNAEKFLFCHTAGSFLRMAQLHVVSFSLV